MSTSSEQKARYTLFALRLGTGWLLFWAALSKILDSEWTAAGFLKGAKTFTGFYQWLGSAGNIGWVNFLNEWGVLLLGAALMLGLFTKAAAIGGMLLMALYYFPTLQFPQAGDHGFLVDDHVIYFLVFLLFYFSNAGTIWGLDGVLKKPKG